MNLPAYTSDVAFAMGDTHTICQDYGRCGGNILAISDGCSSSPDTDWGSRLLVRAATSGTVHIEAEDFLEECADRAKEGLLALAAASYGAFGLEALRERDKDVLLALDATLLAIGTANILSEDHNEKRNHVIVRCGGDGVVVVDYVDGTQEIYKIECSKNMPFYPSYLLDQKRLDRFFALGGGMVSTTLWNEQHKSWVAYSGAYHLNLCLLAERIARVTVMTDGALSFTSRDGSEVDHVGIIKELCAFKSSNGEFVQRRFNRARKGFAQRGLIQNDDLTVGCYNLQAIP